jgi:hypothetical protein
MFEDTGVAADSLASVCNMILNIPRNCQRELLTQGFLRIPTGEHPEN